MNNELQEHHTMLFDNTSSEGTEEWYCPTCGRRIMFELSPNYKMVVLSEGAHNAIHSGSKGVLSVGAVEASAAEEAPFSKDEELALINWKEGLEKMNFESLWNKEMPN